ncbi:hypothetical protein [Streptomyces cinereoruber]|uniref:hypothetical protein n=1 Tax=Streptomyces cinereoruber TaxID=67260 RepID=UPI003630E834
MSELQIALIAAGSAVAGGFVTGFFAWRAGHRQAAAAEAAGRAQAGALISTVQATLDEQRQARIEERQLRACADLLSAGFDYQISAESPDAARLVQASADVEMTCPQPIRTSAVAYAQAISVFVDLHAETNQIPDADDVVMTRTNFLAAIRQTIAGE